MASRPRVFSPLNSHILRPFYFQTTWLWASHDDVVDMMVWMLTMTTMRNSEVFKLNFDEWIWYAQGMPSAPSQGRNLAKVACRSEIHDISPESVHDPCHKHRKPGGAKPWPWHFQVVVQSLEFLWQHESYNCNIHTIYICSYIISIIRYDMVWYDMVWYDMIL